MTPVETMIALRPALDYLDESDARAKSAAKKIETESATSSTQDKLKAVQVQFRKRETEEQMAARLSSYAYLQRKVEEDPWVEMEHFAPHSTESLTLADRLISPTTAPISFKHQL